MPFKSSAQLNKFAAMVKQGDMSMEVFHRWLRETKNLSKLPKRVKKKKK